MAMESGKHSSTIIIPLPALLYLTFTLYHLTISHLHTLPSYYPALTDLHQFMSSANKVRSCEGATHRGHPDEDAQGRRQIGYPGGGMSERVGGGGGGRQTERKWDREGAGRVRAARGQEE